MKFTNTIDAVRIQDNSSVFIKRIDKGSTEAEINIHLSNPALRSNPSNHAAPCLDYIYGNDAHDFIVMPILRHFDDPPFVYVDEVTDFIQQTLEVRVSVFLRKQASDVRKGSCVSTSFRYCASVSFNFLSSILA